VRELREEIGLKLDEPPRRLFKIDACPETDREFVGFTGARRKGRLRCIRPRLRRADGFAPENDHKLDEGTTGRFCERAAADLEKTQENGSVQSLRLKFIPSGPLDQVEEVVLGIAEEKDAATAAGWFDGVGEFTPLVSKAAFAASRDSHAQGEMTPAGEGVAAVSGRTTPPDKFRA